MVIIMQALGLIETKGLIAAIEGADAMVKAAEISILNKTYVGGGLVTIAITGDVGAVKAAVEAGAAAVKHIDAELLISMHIIPRPHEEINSLILPINSHKSEETKKEALLQEELTETLPMEEKTSEAVEPITDEKITAEEITIAAEDESQTDTEQATSISEEPVQAFELEKELQPVTHTLSELGSMNKEGFDHFHQKYGCEETLKLLDQLKVVKLRNLAREYQGLSIAGREISKADKDILLAEFRNHYNKK